MIARRYALYAQSLQLFNTFVKNIANGNFPQDTTPTIDEHSGLAQRLSKRLRVFNYTVSLGMTRSLLCYIATEALLHGSFQPGPE